MLLTVLLSSLCGQPFILLTIVPMNAFDGRGYRLGYGGGYFDRTLAACGRRMVAIGVSYELLRLATIHPQPHDVPMSAIVTDGGVRRIESIP